MSEDREDPSSPVPEPAPVRPGNATAPNWFDQDDQLRAMWRDGIAPAVISEKLGRSVAAIMTRAVRLGLPRRAAPGRKVGYRRPEGSPPVQRRAAPPRRMAREAEGEIAPMVQPAERVCLMCLKKFQSEGRHNRICPLCKGSADFVKGSSLPNTGYTEGF